MKEQSWFSILTETIKILIINIISYGIFISLYTLPLYFIYNYYIITIFPHALLTLKDTLIWVIFLAILNYATNATINIFQNFFKSILDFFKP